MHFLKATLLKFHVSLQKSHDHITGKSTSFIGGNGSYHWSISLVLCTIVHRRELVVTPTHNATLTLESQFLEHNKYSEQ